MIVKFALTEDEYTDSQRVYLLRMAKGRVLFRNLYRLACLTVLLATYFLFSSYRWGGLSLYLLAGLVVLQRAYLWKRKAATKYREDVSIREPIELTIEPDHLTQLSSNHTDEIRWASITACHETKRLFVLRFASESLLTIPKRAFSPGDLFHFKELRQKELTVRTSRENPDSALLKFAVGWSVVACLSLLLGIGYVHNFLTGLPRAPVTRTPYPRADVEQAQSPPARVADLHGRGTVYLIPMSPLESVTPERLVADFRKRYQLSINVLPTIVVPAWASNSARKQYNAEDLTTVMKLAYPKLAADPNAILIGITDGDMYISALRWSWAFSFRDEERFAVISTAHLNENSDDSGDKRALSPEVYAARVRKILTRDIGFLHYRLQETSDYSSLLNQYVDDVEDLDDLPDDYSKNDAEVRAELHIVNGDPCFILRHNWAAEQAHSEMATVEPCSGYYKEHDLETVQLDLRYGLVMDQRTDFLIPDRIPLELTRVIRTQDQRPRAFGIGGNHNLNVFLVGNQWPFNWMDLVLENGGRAHFSRSNWGFGYWDARYTNHDSREYADATIQWAWPGWRLQKPYGGTTYEFPDSGNVSRPEQGALIMVKQGNGDRLVLTRDGAGNLLRAHSPSGKELSFRYDSGNRIISVQSQQDGSFAYEYDASGHLSHLTDSEHHSAEYSYDQAGRLNRFAQDSRSICSLTYDSGGRVASETLSDGRNYRFQYSLANDGTIFSIEIVDSAGPARYLRMSSADYMLDLSNE